MCSVPGTLDRPGVENEPMSLSTALYYQKQGLLPSGPSLLVGFCYRDNSESRRCIILKKAVDGTVTQEKCWFFIGLYLYFIKSNKFYY